MAKILIIDDEKEFVDLVAQRLQKTAHYEVLKAYDGEAGYAVAQSGQPDLILLDMLLPIMSGEEVMKKLLNNPPTKNIPVIILTASVTCQKTDEMLSAGAYACLTKPFDPPELMAKIEQALKAQHA